MRLAVAIVVAASAQPAPTRLDAKVTSVKAATGPLPFSNPSLDVKGTIKPIAGNQFQIVLITLGDVPVESDLRQFTLLSAAGVRYEPIAAGGSVDLIFPIDSMPLGHDLGQILPSDAIVTLTRTSNATVMVTADPHATLALVFQVPAGSLVRALRLPDGSELSLTR
jgi:hypothetical protein